MAQINAVENPIINSPYFEPEQHWLIQEGKQPTKQSGRRPASYFFRVPDRAARGKTKREQSQLFEQETPGEEYLLDLANLLRQRVDEWRQRDYEGGTRITKELLQHWRLEDRAQPLFFAQLEAAETVLFLVEGPTDLLQGIKVPIDSSNRPSDDNNFLRYALKMATGTGKTTVMAMLAAWSILNKRANPRAPEYSDTVLIVCPNITIRDRLRELDPTLGEQSLYRTRDLVPSHRMSDMHHGEVFITNWHNLERRELNDGARVTKRGVAVEENRTIKLSKSTTEHDVRAQEIQGRFEIIGEERKRSGEIKAFHVRETKYYESDTSFVRRVLNGRKGRSSAILVMNDEAHHAYRRGGAHDEISMDEESAAANAREATVWIDGLDRINRVVGARGRGIRLCVDLSATPFYIQGSGNEVGQPFPWVVSDFSLLEAIESGLVKIPQLPTEDASADDTPAYFNVWRWVERQAQRDGHIGPIGPTEVMRYATSPIILLAAEWRKTLTLWKQRFEAGESNSDVPPVFIIVCRDTVLAKSVYDWLANGDPQYGTGIDEFRNSLGQEMTVRIDSKVGEEIATGGSEDETRRLRFVLETVGKTRWPGDQVPSDYEDLVTRHNRKVLEGDEGTAVTLNPGVPPGRDVRCIISVSMLSEGWDATTVTHVVGLRPFGSQLLCEQVIGRALRRTSYAIDPLTGLFTEETAQIFGVPFELIPFKVEGGKASPPSPPANHVFSEPAKNDFEITFPVVEGYQDPGIVNVAVNWDRVGELVLDPEDVPDDVLMNALLSTSGSLVGQGPGEPARLNLEMWRSTIRLQQIAFALASVLSTKWIEDRGDAIPAHRLFPQMLNSANQFLETRVECVGSRRTQDMAINPYFGKAVAMLMNALEIVDEDGQSREIPTIARGPGGTRSTAQVDFHTGKPVDDVHVKKCHLNAAVFDSDWEREAAELLDTDARVKSWVKNDRLGLVIPYRKDGTSRKYLPDFIAELSDNRWLMIEIKGQLGDALIKKAAAERWCTAVSNHDDYGDWEYHLCFGSQDLEAVLDQAK